MEKNIEVLLSCMSDDPKKLISNMNLKTNILAINQTDFESYEEYILEGNKVRIINTKTRGISISRNLALKYAEGDICMLCDDDVIYLDDYKEKVLTAYHKVDKADVFIFDTKKINSQFKMDHKSIPYIRKSPKYKNYGSVRITFKREKIIGGKIKFNENFGPGAKYYSGEDSLFIRSIRKNKLLVYESPEIISLVDYSKSSWFNGYTEEYFKTKGAWLAEAYPLLCIFLKYYFVFKLKAFSEFSYLDIRRLINKGIYEYKNTERYVE